MLIASSDECILLGMHIDPVVLLQVLIVLMVPIIHLRLLWHGTKCQLLWLR